MGLHTTALHRIILLSSFSLCIAARIDKQYGQSSAVDSAYRQTEKSVLRPLSAFAPPRRTTRNEENQSSAPERSAPREDEEKSQERFYRQLWLGSRWMPLAGEEMPQYRRNAEQINGTLKNLKSESEVLAMWSAVNSYVGKFNPGMSIDEMKQAFDKKLFERVALHVSNFVGGSILEYGDFSLSSNNGTRTCVERPSLTLTQVRKMAQVSFGISDFQASLPLCDNGGQTISCNYETGKCCRRPQIEFMERYFDRAVATMALGATRDEAFAPLVHARVLAYVLETCDPQISFRGNVSSNGFWYDVRGDDASSRKKYWSGKTASLISFPVAYEVMYELYSAMLIERLRNRRAMSIPTGAQMRALNDAVYYKKIMAVAIPFDHDLDPDAVFPDSSDFLDTGLFMATLESNVSSSSRAIGPSATTSGSSGIAIESREDLLGTNGMEAEPAMSVNLRPSSRFAISLSVYENRTATTQDVDDQTCNADLPAPAYFPFKFRHSVWDKFEACCASECNFLAQYGSSHDAGRSNCCAGCNRHNCSPNGLVAAAYIASICTIKAPPKVKKAAEVATVVI